MKPALTKTSTITVEMLRADRTLRPVITGIIHAGLSGYVSGLSGDVTGLRGYVTGLSGDVTDLRGDVDDCDISDAERNAGVDIATLVLPA
jgi:hypothetical protein